MAEFRVRRYPGGHFYLTSQIRAVLDDLAADLSACLD
jgi:surfactin synthase thioesterase subunit